MNKSIAFSTVFLMLFFTHQVIGHAIEGTTSRTILRDGQVEIHMSTSLDKWEQTLSSNQNWLEGNIDQVMPANLDEKGKDAFLKKLLEEGVRLTINGKKQPLDVASFKAQPTHHGERVDAVLYARHTAGNVQSVSVTWPKSLGSVHNRFVKPQYRVSAPGMPAKVSF